MNYLSKVEEIIKYRVRSRPLGSLQVFAKYQTVAIGYQTWSVVSALEAIITDLRDRVRSGVNVTLDDATDMTLSEYYRVSF